MLTFRDVQKIVNAVFEESQNNDEFKALAYSNVEKAISIIIERELPSELKNRYYRSLTYYKKTKSTQ